MFDTTSDPDYEVPICEHHRDGDADPTLTRDRALPPTWRIAECPECGYWCEVDTATGEVRPA